MTQEEFNRRQEQAQDYLDDARRKLEVAYSTISDAQGFLDDVEGELDYMKDFEVKEKREPNFKVCIPKKLKKDFIPDATQFILKNLLRLQDDKHYDIYLAIRIED